jgi:hypothetical protein
MLPQVFALHAVVPGEREEATDQVNDTLTQSGWVQGSKDLSENATVLSFEMPLGNVQWLGSALDDAGVKLDDESRQILEAGATEFELLEEEEQNRNIRGTLELTYLRPPKPPEVEEEAVEEETVEEPEEEEVTVSDQDEAAEPEELP